MVPKTMMNIFNLRKSWIMQIKNHSPRACHWERQFLTHFSFSPFRILVGTSLLYVFNDPTSRQYGASSSLLIRNPTYEEAMEEVTMRAGGVGGGGGDGGESLASELAEFLPHLDEANGISEELDKKVRVFFGSHIYFVGNSVA